MYAVTICAGRHIGVAICEGAAVYAVLVDIKSLGMALSTGGRDFFAGGDG